MKIRKYELATAIDKVKSIVQKNEQFPALSGALVKDGYLTASNMEMTVLKEIQQYREIGTVEECREAVEKWNRRVGEQNETD